MKFYKRTVLGSVFIISCVNIYMYLLLKGYDAWNGKTKVEKNRLCANFTRKIVNMSNLFCALNVRNISSYDPKHVITMSGRITGRLGNDLFQIASLIGIAETNGYIPVLPENYFLYDYFELRDHSTCKVRLSNMEEKIEYNVARGVGNFDNLSHSKNWTITGLFQSWTYFIGSNDVVRRSLKFREKYNKDVRLFLDQIHKDGVINIGIHVRRGDFIIVPHIGFTIVPVSYLDTAMTLFSMKFKRVQFIFTSDNIAWCKEHFQGRYTIHFSPFTDPVLDMVLLASCDHVIMTTGTFGWWGGWLSGGMVVYYKDYPKKDSWLYKNYAKDEKGMDYYYPSHWIGLY